MADNRVTEKAEIRRRVLTFLKALAPDEIRQRSDEACRKLCESDEFKRARTVMLFLSMQKEIQTQTALENALQIEKTVLVPQIDWKSRRLTPVEITDLDCDMIEDHRQLRWPVDGEVYSVAEIDLFVVPGLGFDRLGNRLGRGGGFYDRLLSRNGFCGTTCGLALEEQILNSIPVYEYDVPLQMVVTDQCVRRFKTKS